MLATGLGVLDIIRILWYDINVGTTALLSLFSQIVSGQRVSLILPDLLSSNSHALPPAGEVLN